MKEKVVLGLAPPGSQSANGLEDAAMEFEYTVNEGRMTVTRYWGHSAHVTVPHRINGLPVTAIGENMFYNKQLANVDIPGSVVTIGKGAFASNRLLGVNIPDSAVVIGDYAFAGNKLLSVTIPHLVFSIGEWAFANNHQLSCVTISNSVTTIGPYAFFANDLTYLTIPGSVTAIGNSAFRNNRLISVTIGADVALGNIAFDGNFTDVYADEGKQAGTYIYSSGCWNRM
jgi:hypothetical protein